MSDIGDVVLTGFPTREQALASGCVLREQIIDGIVSLADLEADILWDKDPETANWHKRTPEFCAARAETLAAAFQQQKDAEIALAAAMISLEADLPPQRDGKPLAIADNYQPYDVVASEYRNPGERWIGLATSAAAIAAWKRAMLEHAATHKGDVLWWRTRPEVRGQVGFGETTARWIVYSRLMIGNEADTPLARIAAGTLRPTKNMVIDNAVTAEQLAELGWVMDGRGFDQPELSKFDAEKVPTDAKLAFAATIEALPPVVAAPEEIPGAFLHIQTSWAAPTLAKAVAGWGQELLRQIGDANTKSLWWRVVPYADNMTDFLEDEARWVVYSRCSIALSGESPAT